MTRAAVVFDAAAGIRLAADTFGDPNAPVVLMLHGGGQTRHAWHGTARSLADAGWRTITVDLRGHGQSTHPRPPAYALEDFADDVRALIAAITEDPVVVGASLGGIASLLALTESPAAPAAGLVLVDVAHRFQSRGGGRIVSFMEQHPDGFTTLADAAEAVAAYLPHRARPRDTSGLRHNLRHSNGRWKWHWDPEILTQARPLLQHQAQLLRAPRQRHHTAAPTLPARPRRRKRRPQRRHRAGVHRACTGGHAGRSPMRGSHGRRRQQQRLHRSDPRMARHARDTHITETRNRWQSPCSDSLTCGSNELVWEHLAI